MGRDRAARPEAAPLRLFVAVDLPDGARAAVDRALGPWRDRFPDGKWVRPENWHVTVKFLGRTWPRLVDEVHEACREVASRVRPFTVALRGVGVFPGPRRARVLWVGIEDREGGLPTLARELDRRLAEEFRPEKRPFSAHLTVARFNPPVPMGEHADELPRVALETSPFRVSALVLYRSHLSPRGARYEPLQPFRLSG